MTAPDDRINGAIEQLKAWAAEKEIPFSAVLEALDEDTEKDSSLPPFHRSVVWADIHDANGIKFHVVVREGATHSSLMDNLLVASKAMDTLIDTRGWLPADRKPKTDEELAEMRASTQATLDKMTAANTQAKGAQTGDTPSRAHGEDQNVVQYEGSDARVIDVEEIIKTLTQSGKVKFVVRGWPWKQYGVTCWPDSGRIGKLAAMYDLDAWEVGTSKNVDEGLQAVVRLKEEGKPDKVVDWLGDGVLSEELPEGPEF